MFVEIELNLFRLYRVNHQCICCSLIHNTSSLIVIMISNSKHDGPINLLQQTGFQVTMMVPGGTTNIGGSAITGWCHDKFKNSTIEEKNF